MTISELSSYLTSRQADFELIRQDKEILSAEDAAGYYALNKSAPTLVLETEDGFWAYIKSVTSGRIPFKALRQMLSCKKVGMADPQKVREKTGAAVGSVPLVGHGLPVIFDAALLQFDYVYGGTGDPFVTLKIRPADLKRVSEVAYEVDRTEPA
jgi:Cys-tRNA(Pro)/Cys-tRNA(Cys) deacylase